jgi:DNA-binding transcriptional LysR family regulator
LLARVGVMRRAAERLTVSVESLSRHIEQLETELGVCPFQRRPHGISLTSVGRKILQHCQCTSDAFGMLADHVHGSNATLLQHVNLRIDSLPARALLPGSLPFVGVNVDEQLRVLCNVIAPSQLSKIVIA